MSYLAIVGVRMLLTMVVMLCTIASAATLYLFGLPDKAVSSLTMGAVVCWLIRPDDESCSAYMEFQRHRQEDPQ